MAKQPEAAIKQGSMKLIILIGSTPFKTDNKSKHGWNHKKGKKC